MASEISSKDNIIAGILKYSISTWVNLLVGFISVIITTRILNPEVYGMVMIFFSSTNVLLYIATLGLDGALIRFYNNPPKGNTTTQLLYKSLVISSSYFFFLGTFCIYFFNSAISDFIFGVESLLLVVMLFAYTFFQITLRFLNISLRMSFKTIQYNIQNILINSFTRVLIIVAAIIIKKFSSIISVITIGIGLVLILYLFIQREEITPINSNGKKDFNLNLKHYSTYFKFALFSAPTYIVAFLNIFLGQQIIRSTLNAYSLGIFSSPGMFVSILTAIRGGFSTYWSAFVYKYYKVESNRIALMHDYIVVIAIAVASILVVFRDFIYLFIGANFHESKQFFSLLLVMPILNLVVETTDKGIAIAMKNDITLISHLVSVMINVVLCYFLIPLFGLKGAAYANATSAVFLFIISTIFGQKYYFSITNSKKSIIGIIIILMILIIPSIFSSIVPILIFTFFINILAIIIYNVEAKNILKFCFEKIDITLCTNKRKK